MVSQTYSTRSGAASVLAPLGPMGQSELSMSMICLARTPCGVPVLIRIPASPALAEGVALGGEHPLTRDVVRAAVHTRAVRRPSRLDRLLLGAGNVQHDLELQQRRAGGHRIALLSLVRLDRGPGGPRLERFFGLPLRDHEIAVLTLDR